MRRADIKKIETLNNTSSLEMPTLILNKNWQGIDACTVKEAICDVYSDRAKIVHPTSFTVHTLEDWMTMEIPEGDPYIQSVSGRIKIPEVIVHTKYGRIPHRKVVFSRRNLWKRDSFCCQYCGKKPVYDEITIDHVLPRSKGGVSSFENCVLACVDCNKRKDDRTPEQSGMKLFRWIEQDGKLCKSFYHRPIRPKWSPVYAVKRQKVPASWGTFLHQKIDEIYWNTELLP